MSAEVRIRRMTAADVDAAVVLAADLPTAPQWSREVYQAMLSAEARPVRVVLAAETTQGELIGLAVASILPPEAELESIAVAAAYQRQGIARRLFNELARELAAAGATEVILEVRASNAAALAVYYALQFEQDGVRRNYYSHPTEDAVLMRRILP
jgi:[ribosomal protein S18]-alanine N-acetyltransferase